MHNILDFWTIFLFKLIYLPDMIFFKYCLEHKFSLKSASISCKFRTNKVYLYTDRRTEDRMTGGHEDRRTEGKDDRRTGGHEDMRTEGHEDRRIEGYEDRRTWGKEESMKGGQ